MKHVLEKVDIFDGRTTTLPLWHLCEYIYEYASKKGTKDHVHFFNGKMTWQCRMMELFSESCQFRIIDATWIKTIQRGLIEAKVDMMPGTHTNGKLTLTSFIRLTIPREVTAAGYIAERGVERVGVGVEPGGLALMRKLFGVSLPLTEMPGIYGDGLAQATASKIAKDANKIRTIRHVIGDLSITDPLVRLLMTVGHILSNKSHAAHAYDVFQDKKWMWKGISNQALWMAAFLINGMAHARGEVLTELPSDQFCTLKELEGRIGMGCVESD